MPVELITVSLILVVFAIASLYGMSIFNDLNTDVQSDLNMTEAKQTSQSLYNKYPSLMDNLVLFVFTLLILFVIVSVFLLDTHPIFFAISAILLICIFVAMILLANVYDDIASDATLSTFANQFTYTTWIMQNILSVMVGVGFIISIAMFAKFKMVS